MDEFIILQYVLATKIQIISNPTKKSHHFSVTGFLYGLRAILSLLCLEVLKGYISGKNFSILLLYLQIKRYFCQRDSQSRSD
jgi:hypothetical protein